MQLTTTSEHPMAPCHPFRRPFENHRAPSASARPSSHSPESMPSHPCVHLPSLTGIVGIRPPILEAQAAAFQPLNRWGARTLRLPCILHLQPKP